MYDIDFLFPSVKQLFLFYIKAFNDISKETIDNTNLIILLDIFSIYLFEKLIGGKKKKKRKIEISVILLFC